MERVVIEQNKCRQKEELYRESAEFTSDIIYGKECRLRRWIGGCRVCEGVKGEAREYEVGKGGERVRVQTRCEWHVRHVY